MKKFDGWWNKVSMEGDWDYEEYAKQGWEAALEWALRAGKCGNCGMCYTESVIEEELEDETL